MPIDKHPNQHPLRVLALTRKVVPAHALDWLQEHGHVSDLCVTLEEVASADTDTVLEKAGALWAKPRRP